MPLRIPRLYKLSLRCVILAPALHCRYRRTGADQDRRRHGRPWPAAMAAIYRGWNSAGSSRTISSSTCVTVGGGGAQQLAGGSLNIAHSGYPDFARASLRGAPLKIIINDIIASPYAVFAKPQIKQIADLKGKLISIGGVNDVTLIYIKAFLASAGLKAQRCRLCLRQGRGRPLLRPGLGRCRRHAFSIRRPTSRRTSARLHQSRRDRSLTPKIFRSRSGRPIPTGRRRTATR